ncbi:MAG: purine-nucleoside phosphorylase [Oscillospiraceae bacterium]|nr:purine-nucleoside phosphorylase [Oscillospiraceae bacterium]
MTPNNTYPTAHIKATPADFAPTVLMPGDPLRSEFIAKNFLADARLVNNVRGIQGYTGTYKGTPVSVMASGMGMPSMGIYAHELYNVFGVENIIRIGSAGALRTDIALREIVIAMGASTNSAFFDQYGLKGQFAAIATYDLLAKATEVAKNKALPVRVGNLLTSDTFYGERITDTLDWAKLGVLAVEMEAAALYMTAARAGKNALAICTISDSVVTGDALSAEDRQDSFVEMMELALETAVEVGG